MLKGAVKQVCSLFELAHLESAIFEAWVKNFNMENLQEQIEALAKHERNLEMELKDVLTDVSTPENSDEEGEEVEFHQERSEIARLFKDCILNAVGEPTRMCNFIMRFQDREYRERTARKMKKIKKIVKMADIERVLEDPRYLDELRRIGQTYPNHGGREFLNELVAVYCILDN